MAMYSTVFHDEHMHGYLLLYIMHWCWFGGDLSPGASTSWGWHAILHGYSWGVLDTDRHALPRDFSMQICYL